jgi:hypothetical protein
MGYFECCHHCVPPKRYPGCSGKCPEYKEAREKLDRDKAREAASKGVSLYVNLNVARSKDIAAKKRREQHPYTKF